MQRLLLLFIVFLFLCLPTSASAHLAGQPPFFLINGTYTGYYPVYVTSLKNFILPQDSAPQNYLVNTPLAFTIDRGLLPFPDTIIDKTLFTWDYGDGTKGEGLINSHAYTKPGSYLLTVTAAYDGYSDLSSKPLIQAVIINILPSSDYRLPQAVIRINNKKITDPQNQPLTFAANEDLSLTSKDSIPGSSMITKYFWDIGDGTSTTKGSFKHVYTDTNQLYIFPMLRVVDAKGFISDTYVQIERKPDKIAPQKTPTLTILIIAVILFNGLLAGFLYIVFRKR